MRVKIYEINGDASRVGERLADMSRKLGEQNWEPIILVKEKGEQVHMLMKVIDNHISGLTVLSTDGRDVVIVNIMGDIDPEMFASTVAALDIDTPKIQITGGS